MTILREMQGKPNEFLLGNKRIYMNKDLDERLNKILYTFFKKKNEKASRIQRQVRVFFFRRNILIGLKKVIWRKKLWIKFAARQKIKI